ncbi:hypothetical protein AAY473_015438 [Plecturocebus cupreus]
MVAALPWASAALRLAALEAGIMFHVTQGRRAEATSRWLPLQLLLQSGGPARLGSVAPGLEKRGLTLLPSLGFCGTIITHCSCKFLGSNDTKTSLLSWLGFLATL